MLAARRERKNKGSSSLFTSSPFRCILLQEEETAAEGGQETKEHCVYIIRESENFFR